MASKKQDLKALEESGARNKGLYQYKKPNAKVLEKFQSPAYDGTGESTGNLTVVITTNEVTALCPITGQPDFAEIIVRYGPNEWCVESKSLKLYLMGFRNYGTFHEAMVTRIGQDLVSLLSPAWLEVVGNFTARGGISFNPTYEYDENLL